MAFPQALKLCPQRSPTVNVTIRAARNGLFEAAETSVEC